MQMPDGQAGTVDQVALDADAFQGDVRRTDRGNRHVPAELGQGSVQVVPVGRPDAAGEQDAVHSAADQLAYQIRGNGLVLHGLEKTDAAAVLFRFPVRGVQDPVEIQVGDDREHHGQGPAAAALKGLGGQAGRIGVRVDDLLDLQSGGFLHMRIFADHPRHRGSGDAGFPGDIINGSFPVHLFILRGREYHGSGEKARKMLPIT